MPYPYYPNYLNAQSYMQQPVNIPAPVPAQTPHNSGIVWVQGEAGAKSYLVGAGQSVLLMDSESSSFFIKSTDASGMPLPLRVFDYTERVQEQTRLPAASDFDPEKFVTRDEFEELKASIAKKKIVKKEDKDDAE